ncbi:ABC transporter substrate-binding protein [Psychrosphaera sp. F3M07]|jgi:phospholipid transport system substrate-binding protein|uniref:MlaC/ttg2D family ABC transporter substrate-binding protein n=1 Tax=Psychrosphaera sp. F3M07 TaxID=2841560 RepID=UPI001C0826D2|nr:ABC transporter substrate-binding protein [Psychrosphaera sp. F3M07]MBU2918458.1 ABC transporter substrate-binding protein [Psychrosphaera sp. F3M07]
MLKTLTFIFSLTATTLLSTSSHAVSIDSSSPYLMIKSVGEQVFQSVGEAKAKAQINEKTMQAIIESTLMPYIDVTFASYKILGPQLKKTSKEQREGFVEAMTVNLIKTYSSALSQYNNQTVRYEADRDVGDKSMIDIKTELVSNDAQPINMIFKLRKNSKTGEWKAYDLIVEGISLIDAKRSELSKPLRVNGIDYVTNMLVN